NSRHLVTGITYDLSLSTGVAATPNVTFAYDAAGNRTSMTDGLGSVSYNYDQLSRLTSETRMFNGVGSLALNYAYNLANELTSITNPWGAQVGYAYDKVGRPTSVSGSGYAGVSSYVSSIAYRAFGLKEMHYSNTLTLSTQYDNRLRLTQWSIPGVLPMQYSYTWEQSGRVEFVRNQDDQTLDRYFAYDHVGRLSVSRSGNEARLAIGEQVPLLYNGPYSQGYQYDQFGNMTYREGWGGENPSFATTTYTNNKRSGQSYDAAGNLTSDGGQSFTYDATGQAATASYSGYLLQQYYDGDGLRVKKNDNETTATYYLRSSVLGGQVVAEIRNGGMNRGYVYLGGQLLAVQSGSAVWWMHEDPVAKSKRVTNSSGDVVNTIELDPWGGDTLRSSTVAFQPRKFTTYERDGNLSDEGMFRRYNRWWSRFDQPDPSDGSYDFTDPQSFNRYSYVQNDPVNFVDPSGLDANDELGPPPPVPTLTQPAPPEPPPGEWDTVVFNTWDTYLGSGDLGSSFGLRFFVPRIANEGGIIDGGPQEPRPQPHPSPTPPPQTPQTPHDPQKQKENQACLERMQHEIDAARERFRNNFGTRLLIQAGIGAARGAIAGGYAGAVGGGALFGVGAVPGAILGGITGGIFGAAGGVISGAFFWEPVRRVLYHEFDYKGALEQAKKYCNAQYPL
ncbi:MAG TPA: RHS repeat-associated core domain-containing protein, partial [Pyrinomonadaceae bacterium]